MGIGRIECSQILSKWSEDVRRAPELCTICISRDRPRHRDRPRLDPRDTPAYPSRRGLWPQLKLRFGRPCAISCQLSALSTGVIFITFPRFAEKLQTKNLSAGQSIFCNKVPICLASIETLGCSDP